MSYGPFYNQMAPFWDFIADLEEQGQQRGWFGRGGGPNRAAAAGRPEAAGANTEAPVNPWEGGAAWGFGAMPHRHRHGHGHGPAGRRQARRQQQAEAAAQNEKAGVLTPAAPEAEKPVEAEKFPVVIQSDSENQASGSENKRRPGARGGRAGRGGRGNGMGRARRAPATEAVTSDTEKTLSGDETPKAPGPRRGGRGGRGMGPGAARGAAHGPFHGTPFQGMGPRMRRRALIQALHAEMLAHQATMHPQGPMHGPMRGMRGGRGAGLAGRGRGAAMARNLGLVRDMPNKPAGNGLHQGPGPRRGGPNARGGPAGRGMGAGRGRGAGVGPARNGPPFARAMVAGNGQPAVAPRMGPAARRQNQCLAGAPKQGPKQGLQQGPKQRPNQGPKKGLAGPRKQQPGQAGPAEKTKGIFHPLVDVYHHPEAYIIHMSLPGAKKEDIEVNWNSEKSVVIVSGRIERQADEDLLKTLAKKERRIGDFKRRVKLPPTLIDVESITAKMDNGVLKVEVPRLDGFVEVKKVEIV